MIGHVDRPPQADVAMVDGPLHDSVQTDGGVMDLASLNVQSVLSHTTADIGVSRERARRRRLTRLCLVFAAIFVWMWVRILTGSPPFPAGPHLSARIAQMIPLLLLVVILGAAVLLPLLTAGRSPHVLYR